MVRNRTGQTSGVPADGVIQTFLNAGVESVVRRVPAVFAQSVSNAIVQGANSFTTPADCWQLVNVNFSVTSPTASNAVLYPIRIVQEGAFERMVGYAPGQSAGYPTLAFLQSDANNVQTYQIYPVANVAGFINMYYIQRPQIYTDTANSTIQVDSTVQEAMILWAAKSVCESRSMYGEPVQYFMQEYEKCITQLLDDVGRRQYTGPIEVADTSFAATNQPYWYSLDH